MRSGQKKLLIIILMVIAFVLLAVLLSVQIIKLNQKNAQLQARKERLEQLIAEEEERRSELADEEVYVQTQKYIEEKAKSIGYVYPDEIIFRKDE